MDTTVVPCAMTAWYSVPSSSGLMADVASSRMAKGGAW